MLLAGGFIVLNTHSSSKIQIVVDISNLFLCNQLGKANTDITKKYRCLESGKYDTQKQKSVTCSKMYNGLEGIRTKNDDEL